MAHSEGLTGGTSHGDASLLPLEMAAASRACSGMRAPPLRPAVTCGHVDGGLGLVHPAEADGSGTVAAAPEVKLPPGHPG